MLTSKDFNKIKLNLGKSERKQLNALLEKLFKGQSRKNVMDVLSAVIADSEAYAGQHELAELGAFFSGMGKRQGYELRSQPVPTKIYGAKLIERGPIEQIETASRLEVAVQAALMPDAHQGYGLPIGGVLAVRDAVIPYGVGVDIGCRMCLSLYRLPPNYADKNLSMMKKVLENCTRFGTGAAFERSGDHPVLEKSEFNDLPLLRRLKDRAAKQLGTSGSGNHFVDMGSFRLDAPHPELSIPPGGYFAVLSHSGSRNLGAEIASYYTKVAMGKRALPPEAKHLAWLELGEEEGQEYWRAMNLAGDYASACHHEIHRKIAKALGEKTAAMIENHHNFAWKETLADGTQAIVHRKGATPAGKGVLGIIPGTMVDNAYLVQGRGDADSLCSSAHGAGRLMSRSQALRTFTRKDIANKLAEHRVELIGSGADEAPMAYKSISEVIAEQSSLIDVLGVFKPRIVRMA